MCAKNIADRVSDCLRLNVDVHCIVCFKNIISKFIIFSPSMFVGVVRWQVALWTQLLPSNVYGRLMLLLIECIHSWLKVLSLSVQF